MTTWFDVKPGDLPTSNHELQEIHHAKTGDFAGDFFLYFKGFLEYSAQMDCYQRTYSDVHHD